ncbi:hypothetical protein ACNSPA_14215, partial [Yersinia enterocolitica]
MSSSVAIKGAPTHLNSANLRSGFLSISDYLSCNLLEAGKVSPKDSLFCGNQGTSLPPESGFTAVSVFATSDLKLKPLYC